MQPAGAIELVLARPWGTVLRVPVAGGVAWFKACAPIQEFEPRLTAALASRWPDRLPEVLAHNEEHGWLLLGDAGQPAELRETFALAERLGPFGHVFKSLPLLDTIPKPEQPQYLPDLAPTLADCAAAAG